MKKADFIKAVAAATSETQKKVKEIIDAMQDIVVAEMAKEGEVKVMDGLTLVGVKKEARVARNPMDGSTVNVPEKMAPKAKFGKAIKDAINA